MGSKEKRNQMILQNLTEMDVSPLFAKVNTFLISTCNCSCEGTCFTTKASHLKLVHCLAEPVVSHHP